MVSAEPLLEVSDLAVTLHTPQGPLRAAEGVSFAVAAAEAVGLVGESGSGKSVAMRAILGLLPRGSTVSGSVRFAGRELVGVAERQLAPIRGREISMIFQDPMTALNPIRRIGGQIGEVLRIQLGWNRRRASAHARELLARVEIAEPDRVLRQFPHQLSGGMRQRVLIAMALACQPRLILCDEPTTALDVTTQDQILALLRRASDESGAAMIFVSHDLAVVRQLCSRVLVMYAGRLVEMGPIGPVFADPRHAYTAALLRSLPAIDGPRQPPVSIGGELPDRFRPPSGCRFRTRCTVADDSCASLPSTLLPVDGERGSACIHAATGLPDRGAESGVSR